MFRVCLAVGCGKSMCAVSVQFHDTLFMAHCRHRRLLCLLVMLVVVGRSFPIGDQSIIVLSFDVSLASSFDRFYV